jgi:hypothetical protein
MEGNYWSLMVNHYWVRGRWGAQVEEGIVGGVDHWSVCHGMEMGGGLARCDGMQGKMTALGVTLSFKAKTRCSSYVCP